MAITINQINAIATEIEEEYRMETAGMDFATYMSTSNSSARSRVFVRYPKSVVDGYLASERQDDRNNAAASNTKGTF